MARCRVSFSDPEGIDHAVEVQADSLYEAVALAVAEFRLDSVTNRPAPIAEFIVSVHRPAVEHRIRLSQVLKWVEGTRDGPARRIETPKSKELVEGR